MSPRQAVARALARHVFENEESFEGDVDKFIEDLEESGYEVREREPTSEEIAKAAVLDALMDPLTFVELKERSPGVRTLSELARDSLARARMLKEEADTLFDYRRAGGPTQPVPDRPEEKKP